MAEDEVSQLEAQEPLLQRLWAHLRDRSRPFAELARHTVKKTPNNQEYALVTTGGGVRILQEPKRGT